MDSRLRTKLVYDDLANTPDDGRTYELLDGDLFVTPSPSPQHQRVSKRLQRQLEAYFEERGLGEVFDAPLDVILTRHDVVEPDIVVVANRSQISKRAIEGAPILVVEILSPSTADRDRTLKARRYEATGVPHYWIVDIDAARIDCFALKDGRYAIVPAASSDQTLSHPDWPELRIDLASLWAENP
jgi:Uma2 family endonuclease